MAQERSKNSRGIDLNRNAKMKVFHTLKALGLRKFICMGFVALLILSNSGCATVDKRFANGDMPCEVT